MRWAYHSQQVSVRHVAGQRSTGPPAGSRRSRVGGAGGLAPVDGGGEGSGREGELFSIISACGGSRRR